MCQWELDLSPSLSMAGRTSFYVHWVDFNRRLDAWIDRARLDLETTRERLREASIPLTHAPSPAHIDTLCARRAAGAEQKNAARTRAGGGGGCAGSAKGRARDARRACRARGSELRSSHGFGSTGGRHRHARWPARSRAQHAQTGHGEAACSTKAEFLFKSSLRPLH
jgi:hypothetical protein